MSLDTFQQALLDPTGPVPASWPAGWPGVLLLFLVPVGGGIPGGVLLGHGRGLPPPVLMALYLVSDVILAFVFEPVLRGLLAAARHVPWLRRAGSAAVAGLHRTAGPGSPARKPLGLVLVSFTVDPMTGRAAAAAAGHGFVPGWAIAIAGDMIYFTVVMASTLWLDGMLGNAPATIGVVLLGMLVLQSWARRRQERRAAATAG